MALVFGMEIPSKASDSGQSPRPLMYRGYLPGPLDGGLPVHVALIAGIRIGGEAPEVKSGLREDEPGSPTHGQV